MKLGLGTVQFGTPYGVAHAGGATCAREIEHMLALASSGGLVCLDTAPAYGDAEARLGAALAGATGFRVITKTLPVDASEITPAHANALRATFMHSLEKLRQPRIHGLLVHRADDLAKPGAPRLLEAMERLRDERLVEKLGVSVYSGAQIDRASALAPIDIVQLPLSVLDQRLLVSGHIAALKARGVEVHARSVFLQGVLLMSPERLPPYLAPLRPGLRDYHRALAEQQLTPVEAALAWVRQSGVDYAVVGAQSAAELAEIVHAAARITDTAIDCARYAVDDEDMILPPRWKLN